MDGNDDQRGVRPDPPKKRRLIDGTKNWFKNIFAKPATGNASTAGLDEQRQLSPPQELHQSSSTEEHEQGPDERRQLPPPKEVQSSSTEEHEQPSEPAPRRSGRYQAKQPQQSPTAPPVASQEPALLDEAILEEFDRYVRCAWNPTPIPTDERLEEWSEHRLGDILRLELPEPLALEVASESYFNLMLIIFTGEPEADLKDALFSDSRRSPKAFVRLDSSRRPRGQVGIVHSLAGNLLHQHSPYSLVREPTHSAVADALYSATKRLKRDGEIDSALRYIANKIHNDLREPKQSRASQLGAAQSSEVPSSKASSTTGVVETDFSYAFFWRPRIPFRVLKREHPLYRAVLMVVEMKQLQVDHDVKIKVPPGQAKKQYEQGLSQVIKYLYHAWEKFGTRIGLFVCGPFFARLLVTDDKGNIAVECKPCPNVGQEYSSPGSYFKEFDYLSLPHSLLLPYSTNSQLAEQLGVDDPLPLLNLEGLRKFEELSTHVFKSAFDMKVAAALGKRYDPSPTSTSAQGQDSGFPTLCDLSPQNDAAIVKAGPRSPIHWYISARRDAKDRVDEHDVKRFLEAFKAHVLSSSSPPKDSGSHNPDDGEGDNRGREGDKDEGHKDSHHGRSGGYGGYWGGGGGGGGGQGGEKATGAKSGGPQAKEEEFQENFEDDVEENVEEYDGQDFLDKVKSWAPHSADPAFALDPAPCLPPTSRPPSTSDDEDDEEVWPDYVDTDSLPPSITIKAVLSSTMDQLIDDALKEQRLLSGCTADTSERPSPTRTARTDGSGSTPGTASTLLNASPPSGVLSKHLEERPAEGSLREGQGLSE
ncbi:hypothetical protein L198_06615 [Cryptococcus wingfieldii CBS 7118]|uniref:Uncharacterized protein n=1 Tax=Cryptococcus wingfieldii CBS 7118 TaxID=1295528 RepID=A0A1E3IJP9_9TREE|nr:hypothetical protein L198_06615 [Cryptococcus wingfieldii CBS 7118]ODN88813.1 hypothetical protein L198_06615 [Cryptococcus wingfieldii CBS 7118]